MTANQIPFQGLNPCPAKAANHIPSQGFTHCPAKAANHRPIPSQGPNPCPARAANHIPFPCPTMTANQIPFQGFNPCPARAANHIPSQGLNPCLAKAANHFPSQGLNPEDGGAILKQHQQQRQFLQQSCLFPATTNPCWKAAYPALQIRSHITRVKISHPGMCKINLKQAFVRRKLF